MADVAQVLAAPPPPQMLPAGPEERKRRARIAEALAMQGLDTSPVQHWTQGAARVAQVLAGTLDERGLDREERAGNERLTKLLLANPALGGGTAAPAAPADSAPVALPGVGAGSPAGGAIASIESGGRYDALGPVIAKSGDRAYGKYQVMGANVPEWTRTHTGRAMTPDEFLANPDAQEAVFKGQFGGYQKKYGPEGAARAWFAGEGGMNDMKRRDPLGTSVADYSAKFTAAMPAASGQPGGVQPGAAAAPGVPESVAATFQPGVSASPPGGPAAPPAAAAAAPAAGAPARMATQMDPQMQAYVRLLLASRNPQAAAMAQAIVTQYSKPSELKPVTVGDRAYAFDPATGAFKNPIDASKPKFAKFDEGTVLDESSGKITPVAAAGFKPLVDPADRAQYGIPAEDKRPYQLGPGGKLINPPPENRINIDQRGEGAFVNEAGKSMAERFNAYVKSADTAKGMISDINYLRDIGARIPGGTSKSAEIASALGPYAEMAGIKIDGLSDMQAYNAVVARLQPTMRVPGSGATSDYEMRTFLSALPSLGKTPQGNAIISNTLEALQQQHLAAGAIASRALSGEIKPGEAEKQIRELPDPFELWKKSRGAAPSAAVPPPSGFNVVQ